MNVIPVSTMMLLAVSAGWADVRVEILDHPDRVLQYSPVLITAAVVNDGPDTAVLPVGRWAASGYLVETGSVGSALVERNPFTGTTGSDPVKKLGPGQEWLFQIDVREWMSEPGAYHARVGLRGSGRCFLTQSVAEDLGATPIEDGRRSEKGQVPRPYEGWQGAVFSQEVTVQVDEPASDVDLEALKYIMSPEYPVDIGGLETLHFYRLMHGSRYLKERFPQSHYAYVAVFYGSREYDWLLRVQPDNPLTKYTRMMNALAQEHGGSSTASAKPTVQDLGLPGSLERYVLQEIRSSRGNSSEVR